MLPGLDGWQVLRQLKNDPNLRDIPVILTSSLDERRRGLHLGAAEYYVKPLESASLRRAVERLAHRGKRKVQRVAIFDNDAAACQLIGNELRDLGYVVSTFTDGEALLESLRHDVPDALVFDPLMREGDGLDVLRRLQENARWSQIPVIVSTVKSLSHADLTRLSQQQVRALVAKHSVKVEDWKLLLVRQLEQLQKGEIHDHELCSKA